MTDEMNSSERPDQAVFSVCADESVVTAATAASSKVSGAHFAGEFRDYITSDKRPQFSPSLKNAASCVALIDDGENCAQSATDALSSSPSRSTLRIWLPR